MRGQMVIVPMNTVRLTKAQLLPTNAASRERIESSSPSLRSWGRR